jgi:hypothetical protein
MQCFRVLPWPGLAPRTEDRPKTPLYCSYHPENPSDPGSLGKSLSDHAELRTMWESARASCGDNPFWGPCAFNIQLKEDSQTSTLQWQYHTRSSWKHSTSSCNESANSHLSASLGVGLGRQCFGVMVSGKYDRSVHDKSDVHTAEGPFDPIIR